jgi:hypothetical protein
VKMFGEKATPDIASVAAWDGTNLIYQAVAARGQCGRHQIRRLPEGQDAQQPRG